MKCELCVDLWILVCKNTRNAAALLRSCKALSVLFDDQLKILWLAYYDKPEFHTLMAKYASLRKFKQVYEKRLFHRPLKYFDKKYEILDYYWSFYNRILFHIDEMPNIMVADQIVENNCLYLVEKFLKKKNLTVLIFSSAMIKGNYEIFEYLKEKVHHDLAMIHAGKNGLLEMVKILFEQEQEHNDTFERRFYSQYEYAIFCAAVNGHVDIMEYFSKKGHHLCGGTQAFNEAARNGHLEVLQYLNDSDISVYIDNAHANAAKNGHLHVLKWLNENENRIEWFSMNTIDLAAKNGHLEVVKWLHENRSEGCTTGAMDWAASEGHLDIIKWLHENRTEECTTDAMDAAARRGHIDVVKWLHENRTEGCTTKAMDYAAMNEHRDIVIYLCENRTEGCSDCLILLKSKYSYHNLEIFQWLKKYFKFKRPVFKKTRKATKLKKRR